MPKFHIEGGWADVSVDVKGTYSVTYHADITGKEMVETLDAVDSLREFIEHETRVHTRSINFNLPPEHEKHHTLYNADPNCTHRVEAQWSGVKCVKCNGWYCA